MQQQTFKTYETLGQNSTTVPKISDKSKSCKWRDDSKALDRSGCTFTFPIRFDNVPDTDCYTIRLNKLTGYALIDDCENKTTRNKYWYDCECLETGHITKDVEVNTLVHCMNDIDKFIGTFIILIGLKDKVGNGQKATDRPLDDIIRLGVHKDSYIQFYNKYTDLGFYIHVIYGLYALNEQRHAYKCYGGVHKLTGNDDILEPVRVPQHNNNSSSNGYKVLQELSSYWSPCFLLAIMEHEKSMYDKIRKTFEEIEVQCIRLTDCECTNSEYTKGCKKDTKIRLRIEDLLTTEMTDNVKYKTPLLLLTHNCRKMNIHIQYVKDLNKVRFDELTELFTELQCPTPKEYARLILSLCEQFKLNYNKIRDYYKDLIIRIGTDIEDKVVTIYVRGQQSSIDYNKIVEQRLEEERKQQKPISIDELMDWESETDEERQRESKLNKEFIMMNNRFRRKN